MNHTQKRILSILAAVTLTFCAVPQNAPLSLLSAPLSASADGEQEEQAAVFQGMKYVRSEDGTSVTIVGYTDDLPAELEIPSEIDGLPVTSLGQMCFYNCEKLTSVTIPYTIKSFGFQNFLNCQNLKTVNLPAGLESIHEAAFGNCKSLESITLPEGLTTIGNLVFSGCTALSEINMPATVTIFGEPAFADTPWLAAKQKENPLVIVNGCLIDGSNATGAVEIPEGVTTVCYMAFCQNENITKVTMPDTVTRIEGNAFSACTKLAEITFPENLLNANGNAFDDTPWLAEQTTEPLLIVSGVVADGRNAPAGTVIPDNIRAISDHAFWDNQALTEITLPASVQQIGTGAFYNCTACKMFTVENPACIIPDAAETLSNDRDENWNSLFTGTIRGYEGSTAQAYAEKYGRKFESLGLAPDPAFYYDYKVNEDGKGVTITKYTGSSAEVTVPDELGGLPVTEIGSWAFGSNVGVKSVVLPDSVTVIGSSAFNGCKALTAVTLPKALKCIADGAFIGCTGLTAVSVPDGTEQILSQAFAGCTALESIEIPAGVTEIGSSAFRDTPWLKAQQDKDPIVIVNQILIDGSACTGEVKIPDGVKQIGGMSFASAREITGVIVPDSVTSIGENAFYSCSGLKSITLPDSMESIGYQAFYNCTGLTEITIPDSVKEIGGSAFMGCEGLTSVTLPNGLTNIANTTFALCNSLTDIVIPDSLKKIDVRAFVSCAALETLVLPEGTESIGFAAFAMCSNLKSITIPDSVTEIGPTAFSGCADLTVYGNTGSYAETYAQQNGIKFAQLGQEAISGDFNGDGKVTVADSVMLMRFVAEDDTLTDAEVGAIAKAKPDQDEDGSVTVLDVKKVIHTISSQKTE